MASRQTYRPTVIDLFAGAGGLSIGLEKAGFNLIAATDWDHWSCETLRANHPEAYVFEGDITKVNLDEFSSSLSTAEVDLIVGGPPCQGFSQLGKRLADDPRNKLWKNYLGFVEHFNPKIFVIENVPQLHTSQEFMEIKKEAEALGYEISAEVLHAADFGVPQKRKRVIIIGSRIGKINHPRPTHRSPDKFGNENSHLPIWKTVKHAFAGLSLVPDEINWHVGRNPTPKSFERYKCIPEGGNRFDLPRRLMPDCWKNKPTGSTDLFGRLWWDKPSLTIRTEFYKPEKGCYLHPSEHRPITIREAARLQTFPDSYIFRGSKVEVAKQIGNAVPTLLAEKIGESLLVALSATNQQIRNGRINRLAVAQR